MNLMPEQPSEALAKALNDIERARRRCLLVTRALIYPSTALFAAAVLMLLYSSNKWLGLTFGIISLYGQISSMAIAGGMTTLTNTRLILNAIEKLPGSEGRRDL
jgi:hypothetical protein